LRILTHQDFMGDCWNGRLEDANLLISDEEEPDWDSGTILEQEPQA
jgi:hypothetical protein